MKIMVVEDDAALREIYSIRITAEGYEVVTAGDGEEALAVAVREKPDLILADVMMPKISGFDMLDILRNTPETAGIKIIMMTALSGDEQRARGESLGCDRYLVKSQVGIEDVVNTIHEVLGDKAVPQSAPASSGQSAPVPSQPAPVPPVQPAPAPASEPQPASQLAPAPRPSTPTPQPQSAPAPSQPASAPAPAPAQPAQPLPPQQVNYGQPVGPAQ